MNDPVPEPMPSLVGKTVSQRFVIGRKLGEGGMGAVYSAVDKKTQQKVALKVLLESLATDPKAVRRFEKEAMAVSRISHPNIVSMVDYGKSEEGLLFIAMEHLDGHTLFDALVKERCMNWERSLSIVRGIARALAAAHGAGVIHRDLKPDNVMLVGQKEAVKVLDFGLAMVADSQPQMRLTESNIIMGTPGFMSPEQIDGAGVDARSDLYALGILWWQMLVGRPPFDGDTPIKVMMAHVQQKPLPPTEARPGLVMPAIGQELLLRLLAKHPDHRPHDGAAFVSELQALDEEGWHVATALPSDGAPLKEWEDAFDAVWNPDDPGLENPFSPAVESANPFDAAPQFVNPQMQQPLARADIDLGGPPGFEAAPNAPKSVATDLSAFTDLEINFTGGIEGLAPPQQEPAAQPLTKPPLSAASERALLDANLSLDSLGGLSDPAASASQDFDPFAPSPGAQVDAAKGLQTPEAHSPQMVVRLDGSVDRAGVESEQHFPNESASDNFATDLFGDAESFDPFGDESATAAKAESPLIAPAKTGALSPSSFNDDEPKVRPTPATLSGAPSARGVVLRRPRSKKGLVLGALALVLIGVVALAIVRPPFVQEYIAKLTPKDTTHAGVVQPLISEWQRELGTPSLGDEEVFVTVENLQKSDTQKSRQRIDKLLRGLLVSDPGNVRAQALLYENATLLNDKGARLSGLPEALMKEAFEASPNIVGAKRSLALMALRAGDPIAALEHVRGLDDDFSKAIAAKATMHSDALQSLDAASTFAKSTTRVAVVFAEISHRVGRDEAARQAIEKRLEKDPDDIEALVLSAQLEFARAQKSKAQTLLESALAKDPTHAGALLLKARLAKADKRQAILSALRSSRDELSREANAYKIVNLAKSTKDEAAMKALSESMAPHEIDARGLQNAASAFVHEKAGAFEKARALYQLAEKSAVESGSNTFAAHLSTRLGAMSLRQKNVDGALVYFQRALQNDKDALEAILGVLLVRLTKDPRDQAFDVAALLLRADPFALDSRRNILGLPDVFSSDDVSKITRESKSAGNLAKGYEAFLRGDHDTAAKQLARVQKKSEIAEGAQLVLAASELKRDKARKAERVLSKLKSGAEMIKLMNARMFIDRKKIADAEPILNELRRGSGALAEAAEIELGRLAEMAKKPASARSHYRAALAMNPNNQRARSLIRELSVN